MSKKTSSLLLFLSLTSWTATSAVKITEGPNVRHYDFSVDGIKLQSKVIEGETFQEARLLGVDGYTGIKYEVGSPEIPVIRFMVQAINSSDIKVTPKTTPNFRSYKIKGEFKPNLLSVPKIPGASYQIVRNSNFSAKNYPEVAYQIEEAGSVRSQKQFMVTLYPVEFKGVDQSLHIARDYSVQVKKANPVMSEKTTQGIVFVVGSKFKNSPSLKTYIDVKKAQGFNVYTIDVPAKVTADQTRAKIKLLYSSNKDLKFAVIIGDSLDVPGRTSKIINGLTDHYFSAIDTNNYEKDINGPDIAVGRISASDERELSAILKKYTRYIKGDFSSRNWLSNVSFLATNDRWEVAEGTHNYVIDTYTRRLGYTGNFPNSVEQGGDKLYAITYRADNAEVMASITKGRSIIDYSGHGATTFWDSPRVEQSDVRALNSSTSSLPFVISNACITGDYRVEESFAETWQRHEWGAVAFWGSMDSSYWDEDDILEKRMFDGIFKEGKLHFGEITQFALAEVWKYYGGQNRSSYYWETYHVFGDPSINLRLK